MEEEKLQNIAIHTKKIRTMGKDLARLREQEAREERERIAASPKSPPIDVKKPFLAKIPSIKEKITAIKEKIINQGTMREKTKEPKKTEPKEAILPTKITAEKPMEEPKPAEELPREAEELPAEELPLPREELPKEAEELPAEEELPKEAEELPAEEELPKEAEELPTEELPREELPKEAEELPAKELKSTEELKKLEEDKILETKIEETKKEPKEKKEEIKESIPGQEPSPRKKLILPAPLSIFEKIFSRIVIIIALILIFINLFLFCYWYFYIKKLEPPLPPADQQEQAVDSEEEQSPALEITIPLALFPIKETESLEIEEFITLSKALSIFLEKSSAENGFTRILIKDSDKNKLLGIKEFFQSLQIKSPADFSDSLDNNFTFFVYSQTEGPRMGFAALITEKSLLINSLKIWETTMEKDFESFFILLNKKEPALISFFKDGSSQGKTIRYQTFSKNDLGICYVIFEDYFIFTSSWKSMEKVIASF